MKKAVSSAMAALTGLAAMTTVAVLTLAPADADAQSRGAGARGHASGARGHAPSVRGHVPSVRGPGYHSGPRVGVVIGAPIIASPWWGPSWYYPAPYSYGADPYYYPPAVYGPEQAAVYIEQQAPPPASAPQPQQYWYYCQDSKTYYPYVQTCASPWQRVLPHAPPP